MNNSSSRAHRIAVSCVLVGAMAYVADLSADAATKNCETRNCVEIAASGFTNLGDPCWLTQYSYLDSAFVGKAYGTTYADFGYGQDSAGGDAYGYITNGSWQNVDGNVDCDSSPTTGKLPVSGTVTKYIGGVWKNQSYYTVCLGE